VDIDTGASARTHRDGRASRFPRKKPCEAERGVLIDAGLRISEAAAELDGDGRPSLNGRRSDMPTYEFFCQQCRKPFTQMMSIADFEKKKGKCPRCGSKKLTVQITSFQTVTSRKS
jgi:putative FmdB family regulatory protein